MTSNTIPEIISTPTVLAAQWHHVLLVNGSALVGTLLVLPWSYFNPPSVSVFCVTICFLYLTMGVGISVGYHRLFTHRAFMTSAVVRTVFAVLGSMAGQGPVVAWVGIHRRHHKYSDRMGDPHSPHYIGGKSLGSLKRFWHAHFGWFLHYEMPNPIFYCPDLLKDRNVMLVSRMYFYWLVVGILAPGVVCYVVDRTVASIISGILWGGFLRLFVSAHFTWAINSWCHFFGLRDFETTDESRNSFLLGFLVFGEGWHNNHHQYPSSAMFGLKWYQLDLGYRFIKLLELTGLAWKVNKPKELTTD